MCTDIGMCMFCGCICELVWVLTPFKVVLVDIFLHQTTLPVSYVSKIETIRFLSVKKQELWFHEEVMLQTAVFF